MTMKGSARYRQAQSALSAAVLFFSILAITSTLLYSYTARVFKNNTSDIIINYKLKYAEEAFDALMSSTIPDVWYIDNNNHTVILNNRTVLYLILFDLLCRNSRTANISSIETGIERKIALQANKFLIKYKYVLTAVWQSCMIVISNDEITNQSLKVSEKIVVKRTEHMIFLPGKAEISLVIYYKL